ncbi:MAG: glycoside hydrolase family 2 TIM barrel-domain containing protein, partial [Anaerolineales bacterium]
MAVKSVRRRKPVKRSAVTPGKKLSRSVASEASASTRYAQTDTYNGMRGKNWGAGWKFHLGEVERGADPAHDDSAWRVLDLPHDWSIALPFREDSPAGTGGGFLDGGAGWYRKTFKAPAAWRGKRVFIQFDGAYMDSKVWINGALLGARPYGYISFEYDLTPHLKIGKSNTIAVRLENDPPTSRWYPGSGIYRNVWLAVLDPLHVDWCGLFVSTPRVDPAAAIVQVTARVRNQAAAACPASVRMEIFAPGGKRIVSMESESREIPAGGGADIEMAMPVANPRLWSVDDPDLYALRAEILSGGRTADTYQTAFGIRTFALDPDDGFSLNGRWMKLNGVCLHHDLGALGAAVNARAIERQLEIMKAMGCNAVRTSHNPPEPALLDLCDRMGLLVIDEAFDAWEEGNKAANDFHRFFGEWAERDIRAMVRRDRNHPGIIMYSIGNEVHDVTTEAGVRLTERLSGWVRAEDPTRPVTHGSNFNEWGTDAAARLDAVGYNYNTHLYDLHHAQFPDWKMYASETSSAVRTRGVYKTPTGQNLLTGDDLQCSSYDNSIVEWGLSAEESWKRVNSRKFIAGEFIWSGFDYIGEPTPYAWPAKSSYFGIVDTCGFPKDAYYFYRSRWTDRPMLHLLPHWNGRADETVPVWAYTNCDEVELFHGKVSLGVRRFEADGPLHLEWKVPFRPGVLRAVGRKNGRIVARDEIRTAGAPAAVRLSADRNAISADGKDLAFVTADIVDAKGVIVPDAANRVRFHRTGPGEIAGVDNGDPFCREPY